MSTLKKSISPILFGSFPQKVIANKEEQENAMNKSNNYTNLDVIAPTHIYKDPKDGFLRQLEVTIHNKKNEIYYRWNKIQ